MSHFFSDEHVKIIFIQNNVISTNCDVIQIEKLVTCIPLKFHGDLPTFKTRSMFIQCLSGLVFVAKLIHYLLILDIINLPKRSRIYVAGYIEMTGSVTFVLNTKNIH